MDTARELTENPASSLAAVSRRLRRAAWRT
jgi:hypothetical protein